MDFLPKPGRSHEGLQVRRRGPVACGAGGAREATWACGASTQPRCGQSERAYGDAGRPACATRQRSGAFSNHTNQLPRFPSPALPSPALPQMYGFGLVSCVVDNAQRTVKAQMSTSGGADAGWTNVSLEQLQAENQRRAAAKGRGGGK